MHIKNILRQNELNPRKKHEKNVLGNMNILSICDKKGDFVGEDEFVVSPKDFVLEIAKGRVC